MLEVSKIKGIYVLSDKGAPICSLIGESLPATRDEALRRLLVKLPPGNYSASAELVLAKLKISMT